MPRKKGGSRKRGADSLQSAKKSRIVERANGDVVVVKVKDNSTNFPAQKARRNGKKLQKNKWNEVLRE
jgi:hypothetical protein